MVEKNDTPKEAVPDEEEWPWDSPDGSGEPEDPEPAEDDDLVAEIVDEDEDEEPEVDTEGADAARQIELSVADVISRGSRDLFCRLTDEEYMARSRDLALTIEDYTNEEAGQKEQRAQMKARLAELEAKRSKLASIVRQRQELRRVETEVRYLGDEKVELVRLDTGEQIEKRKGHESELQRKLPV